MQKENEKFSQRLSSYGRQSFIYRDEITDANGHPLISEKDLKGILMQQEKLDTTKDKLIRAFILLVAFNIVFSKGVDFKVAGVSLLEVGGPELSSFLAMLLAFTLYMVVIFFQNNQSYSALIRAMQETLFDKGDIDGSVASAWTSEAQLFIQSLKTPLRFSKTDNVKVSKLGSFFYKIAEVASILPILLALFSMFPLVGCFLYISPTYTNLSIVMVIVGWVMLSISVFLAFIPSVSFKNTHEKTKSRFLP